jgi:hypothetical protein
MEKAAVIQTENDNDRINDNSANTNASVSKLLKNDYLSPRFKHNKNKQDANNPTGMSKISKPITTKLNLDTNADSNLSYLDNPRSYGISPFHSSTSLLKSINSITFPKSLRFDSSQEISPGFYKLPELNNNRGASIGLGKKITFKDLAHSPPPNKYNIQSIFDENLKKGKGAIFHVRLNYKNGVRIFKFLSICDVIRTKMYLAPRNMKILVRKYGKRKIRLNSNLGTEFSWMM